MIQAAIWRQARVAMTGWGGDAAKACRSIRLPGWRRTAAGRPSYTPNSATKRRFRAVGRCRRGVAAVEFAIVATPLMVLIFGFISFSAVFYTWSAMQNAAQYAALMVATGQIKNLSSGALSSSNTTATTHCSSSLTNTEAEYYACENLPSWATFTVTTTESCSTPSVEVSLSTSASTAAIADIFQFFTGKTLVSNVTVMKEGSCP